MLLVQLSDILLDPYPCAGMRGAEFELLGFGFWAASGFKLSRLSLFIFRDSHVLEGTPVFLLSPINPLTCGPHFPTPVHEPWLRNT